MTECTLVGVVDPTIVLDPHCYSGAVYCGNRQNDLYRKQKYILRKSAGDH